MSGFGGELLLHISLGLTGQALPQCRIAQQLCQAVAQSLGIGVDQICCAVIQHLVRRRVARTAVPESR